MHRRSQSEVPSTGGIAPVAGKSTFQVGDKVEAQDKKGIVRFDGVTEFSPGRWIGIELESPEGKNDGSVLGKRYFECRELYGLFVRPSQVKVILPAAPASPAARRRSGVLRSSSSTTSVIPERGSRVAEIKARISKLSVKAQSSDMVEEPMPVNPTNTAPAVAAKPDPVEASAPEEDHEEEGTVNFAPTSLVERGDQMVPFRQFEELRIRMRVLEAKRAEDLVKWSKLEKVRNEVEQFRILRKRMSDKLKELQDECVAHRQTTKDLRLEKELMEEKLAENEIQIETLTLDREIAEEKVDYLQHHLDTLKDSMDEAAFMADRSQDAESVESKVEQGYDARSAQEIVNLQAQNERLKAALYRYREVATQNESQLRSQLRLAEEEAATHKQFKAEYHTIKAKLTQAEEDAEMLKARLEDFGSAEDMIETLTQQNLNLHDKVERMAKDIEELEALKEVNDELEETHIENNRQMLLEIDHKDVLIRDLQRRVDTQQEAIADHANTLGQYRQLVASLQEDLKQVQQRAQLQMSETESLQSQSQKMLSLNSTLQSQVVKAQAKAIDLELRKLDALQATEHLRCIEPYLPESFFKRENDAIRTLLQLKRLHFKACLMGRHLCDQYPIKSLNSLIGTPGEFMALDNIVVSNYEFRHYLTELAATAAALIAFLSSCTVPQFLSASSISHDLGSIERKFDAYLNDIRREDFLSSRCISDVQGLAASLAHLFGSIVDSPVLSAATDSVHTVVSASDLITIKLSLAYRALSNPSELSLAPIISSSDKGIIAQDFLRPLSEAIRDYQKVRTVAKKLLEANEESQANGSLLNPSLHAKLNSCKAQHAVLIKFANDVSSKVVSHLHYKQSHEESVSPISLQNQVYQSTQAVLEANEVACFDAAKKFITGLETQTRDLLEATNNSEGYIPAPTTSFPWVLRSHEFKKEIVVNTATEHKLVSLNKDIARLSEDARSKDQTLAERELKIELLDSRMNALREQLNEAEKLGILLSQAQEQERLYLEAVEKLQSENQTLEIENIELRQALVAAPSAPEAAEAPVNPDLPSIVAPPIATGPLDTRVEVMAKRVAHLTDLNLRRKAAQISLDLQFDPVFPEGGRLASLGLSEALSSATSQAAALNKELSAVLTMPQIMLPSDYNASRMPHLAQSTLISTYASRAQQLESLWQDARAQISKAALSDALFQPAITS